jgi:hypothetical protein
MPGNSGEEGNGRDGGSGTKKGYMVIFPGDTSHCGVLLYSVGKRNTGS